MRQLQAAHGCLTGMVTVSVPAMTFHRRQRGLPARLYNSLILVHPMAPCCALRAVLCSGCMSLVRLVQGLSSVKQLDSLSLMTAGGLGGFAFWVRLAASCAAPTHACFCNYFGCSKLWCRNNSICTLQEHPVALHGVCLQTLTCKALGLRLRFAIQLVATAA